MSSKNTQTLKATTVPPERLRDCLIAIKEAGFAPVTAEIGFEGSFRIWFIIPPDTGTDDWAFYDLAKLNEQ